MVRRALARAPLMVLSSIMEGGANVISEAFVAGVPILASEIPGSIGLLGRDYPGYFPVGDTVALTELLQRAETGPTFLEELNRHCVASRASPRLRANATHGVTAARTQRRNMIGSSSSLGGLTVPMMAARP